MQNDEDELINQTQQRQSRDYDIAFNLQNNINMNKPEEKLQETNLKDPPTSSESDEIAQPPISRNNQELMDNDDDSVSSLSLRYNFKQEYALKKKDNATIAASLAECQRQQLQMQAIYERALRVSFF